MESETMDKTQEIQKEAGGASSSAGNNEVMADKAEKVIKQIEKEKPELTDEVMVETDKAEKVVERVENDKSELTDEMKQAFVKGMHSQVGTAAVKLEYIDFTKVGKAFVKKHQPPVPLMQIETHKPYDGHEPPYKKSKKNRGRNTQRPRDARPNPKDNICQFIATDRECPFAEKCQYTHDVKAYFANKPPDIKETCYNFQTFGKCPFGLACRFSGHHTSEEGTSIIDEEKVNRESKFLTRSILTPSLKSQLRKKIYNFPKTGVFLNALKLKKLEDENKYYRQRQGLVSTVPQAVSNVQGVKEGGSWVAGNQGTCSSDASALAPPGVGNQGSSEPSVLAPPGVGNQGSSEPSVLAPPGVGNQGSSDASALAPPGVGNQGSSEPSVLAPPGVEEGVTPLPAVKKTVTFNDKLYLAPLTTVGNLPFRRVCKRLGADITCGEMAMCTNLLQGQPSEWALLKRHASEDVFGVQICGSFPDTMTKCTEMINNEINVDFIDINVGCPIDLVFKKGAGSALMCRMSKFEDIVHGMVDVSDVPITVKMRAGIDNRHFTAHKIIPKVLNWGASLVTVHGRTREQRYTRAADWDYLEQCAAICGGSPFLGNGDIFTFEDANRQKERSGVSSVMIARGALIKPWIFTEIKEQRHWDISSSERYSILQDFTNFGLEHWGSDQQGVDKTRRFMLEWLSFLYRYIPVGVLERVPQRINERPPQYVGRDDLETLMASPDCKDWIKISEMLLGPVQDSFQFLPKHKANSYSS